MVAAPQATPTPAFMPQGIPAPPPPPQASQAILDLPLIVPAGARVYWISLRVPKPINLVGTTDQRLKVATGHTDVNPNIAVASGAIALLKFS